MKRLLIGLDIGTSGAKCIICDDTGKVLASSTQEYPLYTPKPGWAEQNPEDWWEGVKRGLKVILEKVNCGKEDIAGISFSGQMHGLVALDEDNNVIRPSILWCDQRTQKQCDWITEKAGGIEGLKSYTNNQMLTGYTGGKILWLRDEEKENFDKMKVFFCPKDYIRFKLTGKIAIDVSDASGTGFFDTKQRKWSDALIELAGLDKSIFPEVIESTALAGTITDAAAEETGLPAGLNVYAGGGDAVIQTTGTGLVKPGVLGVVIGTSGNVSMGMDSYQDNPGAKLQMFCNNEPGLWHCFGCTLTAGGAFNWYQRTLAGEDRIIAKEKGVNVYDQMTLLASESPAGSNGVVFAPYLTGERCPYPDPNARGMFYGLSLGTTRGDITRSVMEGVTFSLKQVVELMSVNYKPEKVYLSGGGASSELWKQMAADIFEIPVYTMSAAKEGGAFGAVLVAGVGAGVWKNLEEAITVLKEDEKFYEPSLETRDAYRKAYELYKMLYHANKPVFDAGA
ncbi:MAG: xylulokinase [Clostridia bacterium]|nr:xylulokinase [Clostridia bacterium]MBQ4157928.1 xylulokinase [Clostridia bacterium]